MNSPRFSWATNSVRAAPQADFRCASFGVEQGTASLYLPAATAVHSMMYRGE